METNPAAYALMCHWLHHGPMDIATGQRITRGYDSAQRRLAWQHYLAHIKAIQEPPSVKLEPIEELTLWLVSMESPADFAGFEFMFDRATQVEAYKSLPPDIVARVRPMIAAYKADPDRYLGGEDAA